MWTSLPKLFETVCLHLVKGCKDKVSPSGRLRWKWRLSGKIFFFSRQQPTLAILQPDDAERSYSTNTLKMTYLLGMIDPNDHMSRWTWQKQYFKEEVLTYILQPPDPWTVGHHSKGPILTLKCSISILMASIHALPRLQFGPGQPLSFYNYFWSDDWVFDRVDILI